MKRAVFFMLAASLAALPASAQCVKQTLSADQRAAMAQIVFEGQVTATGCECSPLGQGYDKNGSRAFCTDKLQVTKPIMGMAQPQYEIKTLAMLDPDPDAVLSDSECRSDISDRHDRLVGKTQIFYLRSVDGFYQYVLESTCQ